MMKTKRLLSLGLAAVIVFCFAACGESTKEDTPVLPDEPSIEEQIANDPKAQLKLTLDQWPRVDGATAMLPYYEEMAARILDIPVEEARTYVKCSTTNMAYSYLMQGMADIIFCAPPSDSQIAEAKSYGFEFDSAPVLNSGFVFFVNKNNPVDSLTKQQVHDIYAGKITNWKELGGEDEEIIAYQRSEGSGSQSGLYQHVIPQFEVMDAPSEIKIDAMAGIIDAVAEYDNARAAIGYSYYYYITNMHYQEEVKLLAIDNVYPTNETISAGMYPFISKTAAFFSKNEPEDSVVRQIASWCSSAAGNKLALDLGYVPSKDSTMIIPAYKAIKPSEKIATQFIQNNLNVEQMTEHALPDEYYAKYNYIKVSGLKDKAVEDKINSVIKNKFDEFYNADYVPKYVGSANKAKQDKLKCSGINTAVHTNANNLLSIVMTASYYTDDYSYGFEEVQPFTFNLKDASLLSLEDIFDKKDDGFEYLNSQVADSIASDEEVYWDNGLILTGVFKGIKDDQKFFLNETDGSVMMVFDYNTPEFYASNYPVFASASLQGYVDFEKFIKNQSLFEDESINYYLVCGDIGKAVYSGVEVPEGYFGDRQMYSWTPLSQYENVSEKINMIIGGDQTRLENMCDKAIAAYDDLKAKGYDVSGEVVGNSNVEIIGDYTCCDIYYSYNMNYGKDTGWDYINVGNQEQYCFKNGSDTPLEFKDIFAKGVDYETLIKETMRKSLENVVELNQYMIESNEQPIDMSQSGMDDFINAAYDNMIGFGFDHTAVSVLYDNLLDVFNEYLEDDETRYYVYSTALTRLPFSYIGNENLVIFK